MAGDPLGAQAISELKAMFAAQGSQSLIFCLRYDFSTEWAAFVDPHATANFSVTLTPDLFPYFAQAAGNLTIDSISLYAADPAKPNNVLPDSPQPAQVGVSLPFTFLSAANAATLSLPADAVLTRDRSRQVFMIVGYHFGSGN